MTASGALIMKLGPLFEELADAFDGDLPIEKAARAALRKSSKNPCTEYEPLPLPDEFRAEMARDDAHAVCHLIGRTPLPWAPPLTSSDPNYLALCPLKVHVELLGPDGLVHSDEVGLGLYGLRPQSEYGLRTHPAEEVFVMLAGRAGWKRGSAPFSEAGPRERSHHPSGLPHATMTGDVAFLSAYAWVGDLSTENYVYMGHAAE